MKKAFIIIAAVAYILGQVARIQLGNIAFTLLDLVMAILASGTIFWVYGIKRQSLKIGNYEKLIGVFLLTGIIGLLLYSNNLTLTQMGISLLYPLRLIYYLCIFYVVRNWHNRERQFLISLLIIIGIVIVALGFVQYLFYPALKNLYYLGWDEHLYRLFSVFLDPNFASAFFALFLLFIFELGLNAKTVLMRLTFGVLIGLTLLALLLTYSRTGVIMFFVGGGVFLISYLGKKTAIIVLTIFLILFFALANTKIEGLNPFRTASSSARITSAGEALKIIYSHPIFGVGFNAYRYAQINMGYRLENPQFPSHADAGTDNSYLFVLATTGITGFGIFIVFWFRLLRWAKFQANNKVFLGRSIFAVFCSVLVGSFFINLMFYPMVIVWLVVNSALIQNKKS